MINNILKEHMVKDTQLYYLRVQYRYDIQQLEL